jgi:hypothetical protein
MRSDSAGVPWGKLELHRERTENTSNSIPIPEPYPQPRRLIGRSIATSGIRPDKAFAPSDI